MALPLAIGSSLALLAASTTAVYAYQTSTGDEIPDVLLIGGALDFGAVLALDIIGVSTSISTDENVISKRWHQKRQTKWKKFQAACKGARLVGNGFNVVISPEGTLSAPDEDRVVRAWIRDEGPLHVEIFHMAYPLYVSPEQKCLWARKRGLDLPEICPANDEVMP
ncbi:MAG: hypothetical protein GY822_14240 [Deltaproteobacteria bacterium]|nr:hypothetical protein [Deltaproteobacteria bacterium]